MSAANLIFPHQLFEDSALTENEYPVFLIEEYLFFRQYAFHKQKIAFHRASMKAYEQGLQSRGKRVQYISASEDGSDIRILIPDLVSQGIREIHYLDPTDDWLEKRIQSSVRDMQIKAICYDSPMFLNQKEDLLPFFRSDKKKFFQTKFYIAQRKQREILLEEQGGPMGGKWSYDSENRKKYPRKKKPPLVVAPTLNTHLQEAKSYAEQNFATNPGNLDTYPLYPADRDAALQWLKKFLQDRFEEFGSYEDAIVAEEHFLHHSMLTPLLNVGLLSPKEVVEAALQYANDHEIPLNSIEGFIRQIIGWREFIRGIYHAKGGVERTTNFWGFHRKIPASFYDATTGIAPIDLTIQKVLRTGYCHHIERLMVLGNFMLLCEFDPDEVYRWFMELFIDAYDWVMVPNVYGMSQFADGGLMSTKPYISGSNYLKKMSNFSAGSWQEIWDGLFWRFMHVHRDFFLQNPRMAMLIRSFDKMTPEKQLLHIQTAESYLNELASV